MKTYVHNMTWTRIFIAAFKNTTQQLKTAQAQKLEKGWTHCEISYDVNLLSNKKDQTANTEDSTEELQSLMLMKENLD